MVLVLAIALHSFLERDSIAAGTAFFSLAAALIYLRSVFQFVWLLAVVAALMCAKPRRLVLACSTIPLGLVLFLYAKNFALFGTTATSSWLGMNMARVTVSQLEPDERNELVKAGTLHKVSLVRPFSEPAAYANLVESPAPQGVPVLDRPTKEGGAANFNAWIYLQVSRDYLADALWVVRNRPDVYRSAVDQSSCLHRPISISSRPTGRRSRPTTALSRTTCRVRELAQDRSRCHCRVSVCSRIQRRDRWQDRVATAQSGTRSPDRPLSCFHVHLRWGRDLADRSW